MRPRLAAFVRSAVGCALPVACAAFLLCAGPGFARERWVAPVAGEVARGFDLGANPFEGGRHRGADFAAQPGAVVRAACAGPVLVAGRVGTSGRVVTVRCGPWRVSHLPLAQVTVDPGAVVARGARIGTAAASARHAGLHLGVRREGDRFGYADPLRFIVRDRLPPPPLGGRPPRAGRPRARPLQAPRPLPAGSSPVPAPAGAPGSRPVPATPAAAGSSPVPARTGAGLAPWPAWAGLALLLLGAVGAGVRWRPRARRASAPQARAQEVR